MIRTTITLPNKLFEEIKEYCELHDQKISSIFRKGARKVIENGN